MYKEMFIIKDAVADAKAIVGEENFDLFTQFNHVESQIRCYERAFSGDSLEKYGKVAEESEGVESWKNRVQDNLNNDYDEIISEAKRFMEIGLFPANVKVGMGATEVLYSDRQAYTIVEVRKNGKQIVLQRDKAILDPNFHPEFIEGGFCGHCTNQYDQRWTYERNPNGTVVVANWSAKRQRYYIGGVNGCHVAFGRSEFYDYNF